MITFGAAGSLTIPVSGHRPRTLSYAQSVTEDRNVVWNVQGGAS